MDTLNAVFSLLDQHPTSLAALGAFGGQLLAQLVGLKRLRIAVAALKRQVMRLDVRLEAVEKRDASAVVVQ